MTSAADWLTRAPIAHRGYHDRTAGRAENSLSAFRAAVDAGFAIECDLQPAADGTPMVFHDSLLRRMTGIDGRVDEHLPDALAGLNLAGTGDGIHPLSRHLQLVAGRVGLVLELKSVEGSATDFVSAVAEAVSTYRGPVAVMSFDHALCAAFADAMPGVLRGLTAEGGPETHGTHERAMTDYDLQFISYDVNALPDAFVAAQRAEGVPVITWTVRDARQRQLTRDHADQMTFEGFDPRETGDVR